MKHTRATKEIGHVCPARRLFVPLMLNSAFNKTEQFSCVGIKSVDIETSSGLS